MLICLNPYTPPTCFIVFNRGLVGLPISFLNTSQAWENDKNIQSTNNNMDLRRIIVGQAERNKTVVYMGYIVYKYSVLSIYRGHLSPCVL